MRFAIVLMPVLLTVATAAYAQGQPANCHGLWTATLASGRPHGDLSRCGTEIVPDVVRALERAHQSADTVRVGTLVTYATNYRHPAIFDAASALAQDKSARHEARIAGLLVLSSQLQHKLVPKTESASVGQLLTREHFPRCQWESSSAPYSADGGLPPDWAQRIRSLARALANDADAAVRSYAGCLTGYVTAVAPEVPPAGAITVANKCGTVFTISNSSGIQATVRWAVEGSDEEGGEYEVRPHSSVTFLAFDEGVLRVYLGNELVGTAESSKTECR